MSGSIHPIQTPLFILCTRGGVNDMANSKPIKIGIVSLAEIGPRHWQVRYRDPQSGRDVRRRLEGLSKTEALNVAATVSTSALSERGFLPGKQTALPTIHEALAEGIKLSRQRPQIRKASCNHSSHFERWIKERFRGVKSWDQLQPRMIQAYVVDMEERGLAPDTVKNRLKPVKAAWRLMAENFPDRVRPLPRIRLATPKPTTVEILTPFEVSLYLDFLRVTDRYLHAFETTRFLCGLRMLETAALRAHDVDFESGVLTITETPSHIPKTKHPSGPSPSPPRRLAPCGSGSTNKGFSPLEGNSSRIGSGESGMLPGCPRESNAVCAGPLQPWGSRRSGWFDRTA